MYLLVAGFRYKNAPIEIRERFSFVQKEIPAALKRLLTYPSVKEAVILSTCGRTEVYMLVEDVEVASGSVVRFLSDYHGLDVEVIRRYMFTFMHEDTAKQLIRVASGLDSLVIGEDQIIHQVKEAFSLAQQAESTGSMLNKLFNTSLSAAKRIKTEAPLGNIITNLSSAAVELLNQKIESLKTSQITIIGSGQMAMLAFKSLTARYKALNITFIARDKKEICSPFTGKLFKCIPFSGLNKVLATSDVVLVCTAAPHVIVKKEHLPSDKSLIIVDMSVPRNVDPEIADINGIKLFNTDDLHSMIDKDTDKINKMIIKAESIADMEADKFWNWYNTVDIIPTIGKIRDKIELIRKNKLDKLRSSCPYSQERCKIIEEVSRQIVQTILHDPTVRIKSTQDHEKLYDMAVLLSDLFNLNGDNQDKETEIVH